MRVNGLDNYEGGERRCRFGVAGSSAAYTTKIPSADPLRPELSQIELRCRAPPCMQWGCLGTVEVTLAPEWHGLHWLQPAIALPVSKRVQHARVGL